MGLSRAAEARVRAAIAQASSELAALKHRREVEVRGVERLVAAWEALQPEAQWWIQCELADQAGDAEPADLHLGAAAKALLAESAGRKGERADVWSVRAAVRELFAAYVDADGEPEVGNRAHRRTAGLEDHPTCVFVAEHLLRLFPDIFRGSTFLARQRADTYLRDLDRRGELRRERKGQFDA